MVVLSNIYKMVPSEIIFTNARARNYVLHNFGVLRLFFYFVHCIILRELFAILEYILHSICLHFMAQLVFGNSLSLPCMKTCPKIM